MVKGVFIVAFLYVITGCVRSVERHNFEFTLRLCVSHNTLEEKITLVFTNIESDVVSKIKCVSGTVFNHDAITDK